VSLTIREQAREMRARFPQLHVTFECDWMISWEGSLRPLQQSYVVRVFYVGVDELGGCEVKNYAPEVEVLSPLLQCRSAESIPHIYYNSHRPERPHLCLYDPAEAEWTPGRSIADTTIPWAIDWLACYEGWFATGEWHGGGRHPLPRRVSEPWSPLICPRPGPPDRSVKAAFHSLAAGSGVSHPCH
jgi:hypothetical protein